MAASPSGRLQSMLQASVQSVQWTYSLFWQLCPQQGILRWGDGFYNGEIRTRRTVEAMEVSSEEASLKRSQQLRELYESLMSAGHGHGDTDPPTRRPCAALSPEDLTESEWFYLMCVSFSFPPGVGLPGKAYARRQHVWLAGANEVDSKTFARAILAKSARVQTVVCIPLLEGVVEFGTTDKVQEDINFIQHVKSFFIDHHPPTPKPTLSEHSASNPFSAYPAIFVANIPKNQDYMKDDKEYELDSEAETVRKGFPPSELMEMDMLADSPVGSPDDGSNLLDSAGLELLPLEPVPELYPGEYDNSETQTSHLCTEQVIAPLEDFTVLQGHTHYFQTVSTILHNSSGRWPESPSIDCLANSFQSAFAKWSTGADGHHLHVAMASTPQWLLKYILFTVPYLHAKHHHHSSPQTLDWPGKGPTQDEQSASHVAAERRRREKLNEKFITLRSLVPFVTKMDKASILGDTIEYVKQLHEKIKDLEARNNHKMEDDQRWRSVKKRKERVVEVSIIEGEALLEVECMHREGLLLDVMGRLREVGIEVIGVQSSLKDDDGVFVAELRAKVKENAKGNKVSILEVKKALHNVIPHHDRFTGCD